MEEKQILEATVPETEKPGKTKKLPGVGGKKKHRRLLLAAVILLLAALGGQPGVEAERRSGAAGAALSG